MPAERVFVELDDALCSAMLPPRDARSHKGSHGSVLCLCGSLDYAGAALLASAGAARAGAGLVALAVPASLQGLFAGRVPEIVTLGLPEDVAGEPEARGTLNMVARRHANALLCGSGWRESEGHAELLRALLAEPPDPAASDRERPAPMVVDGGALNLLARGGQWWKGVRRACVLTPHPGEFARLAGSGVSDDDGDRRDRARAAAERFGQVVVLKGARTVVAAPDGRAAVAPFENPALATAGTGDVLAGMIAALIAQGVAPFEAACLGVYLHGAAAGLVRERLGDAGMLASDLLPEIPVVRQRLARLRQRPAARVGFASRRPAG